MKYWNANRGMSSRQLEHGKGSPVSRLSAREIEILRLVGEGKNSQTIAQQLHLSFKTVEAHLGNISMIFKLCGASLLNRPTH